MGAETAACGSWWLPLIWGLAGGEHKSCTDEWQHWSDEQSAVFFIHQLWTLKTTSRRVLNELWPWAVFCSLQTDVGAVTFAREKEQNRKTNAGERVNLPAHHHHHGPILPLSIATESPWSHYRLQPERSDSPLFLAFLYTVPLLINIFC